ncbi:MAG: DNA polymerase II large subunit [Candidatus Micrarchaeia archaeon]
MNDLGEYFSQIEKNLNIEIEIAKKARAKGFDATLSPEIALAGGIGERVEGITQIKGIAKKIEELKKICGDDRTKLAFSLAEEICKELKSESLDEKEKVAEKALRASVAVLTEGVLVAPTEGISSVKIQRNKDSTPYLAIYYSGPIRSAGGTAAATSVLLGEFIRKKLNLFPFKASETEIERYVEEINLYHLKSARLQYKPSDDDIRTIVANVGVCIDGNPTDVFEVTTFRDVFHFDKNLKPIKVTNRIRGGVALVICEGIAQKATKVSKIAKSFGIEWDWIGKIIKVKKQESKEEEKEAESLFLEELVAGRPIFSYPSFVGGFRLRYGRTRLSGIAAKAIHPATMILLSFTAIGTQMKVEKPGKGCIITPCDSIEGPLVRLKNGNVVRINSVKECNAIKKDVEKILSLGDILITFGDFHKANVPLAPSSYVEEFWLSELKEKSVEEYERFKNKKPTFEEAFEISKNFGIPMHPSYIFDYWVLSVEELNKLRGFISFDGSKIEASIEAKELLEKALIPHEVKDGKILIKGDEAKAIALALAIERKEELKGKDSLEAINQVAPFKVMKRSTFIGARMGRPEKAKERLMKPAPNVLFPTAILGNRERILSKAKIANIEVASYYCEKCKEFTIFPYCPRCKTRAKLIRKCPKCGYVGEEEICPRCKTETIAFRNVRVDIEKILNQAFENLGIKNKIEVKGVRGLIGKNKVAEAIEKGILRAKYNLFVFKDGTCRFDSTDAPLTHFYPKEIHTSVEKLRELGYTKDYLGNELKDEEQLVELMPQDIIINREAIKFFANVARFIDEELEKFYGLKKYYNIQNDEDIVGKLVITLSPHTSTGVLARIIGYTDAKVGFAHPYLICARRRNCDGDEDSAMLLLDALINFSKEYLPSSTGGTMDAPIVLTKKLDPKEIDDEVYSMEIIDEYPKEFYYKTLQEETPSSVTIKQVKDILDDEEKKFHINFTHEVSSNAIEDSPKESLYVSLKTMNEKIEKQFELYKKLNSIKLSDAAERLITSHFLPDIIGNLHSFSKQEFRCVICNTRYRRPPLNGKCPKDGGRLLLTIPKGGIEKYVDIALEIAKNYQVSETLLQRIQLIKKELSQNFQEDKKKQFSISSFL